MRSPTGPNGRAGWLEKMAGQPGTYEPRSEPAAGFFEPGQWTISGQGGPNVGAFLTSISLPPLPEPVVPDSIAPGDDLILGWQHGVYDRGTRMLISVNATAPLETDQRVMVIRSVRCLCAAGPGVFSVPGELLAQLGPAGTRSVWLTATPDFGPRPNPSGLEYAPTGPCAIMG